MSDMIVRVDLAFSKNENVMRFRFVVTLFFDLYSVVFGVEPVAGDAFLLVIVGDFQAVEKGIKQMRVDSRIGVSAIER